MRFLFLLPALTLSQAGDFDRVDADQFSRIIESMHKSLRDYSFICEGNLELGPAQSPTDQRKDEFKQRYQGLYRYRNDGATYLDVFLRRAAPGSLVRKRHSLIRDISEEFGVEPDLRVPAEIERKRRSPLQLFSDAGSPQKLVYHWYFERFKDLRSIGYEHLGWEDIDGHRCIKIQTFLFSSPPPPGKTRSQLVFWIDLERSGNPLRVDVLFDPPHVANRSHEIKLKQFSLPRGDSIWFPVSGVNDSFMVGFGDYRTEPVVRTSFHVVTSSLLFNQSPGDTMFSVKQEAEDPSNAKLALRKEFVESRANAPLPLRTDRKSVEERLDRQIEDADRMARMIQASSPARETWGASTVIQILFGTLGAFLLLWFFVRRTRR